jgi:hypothetical protein
VELSGRKFSLWFSALRSDRPTRANRVPDASVSSLRSAQDRPRGSLMKLFKLLSQGQAVELRAAQQMLMQFAPLKSS